jgi:hypothetical protein
MLSCEIRFLLSNSACQDIGFGVEEQPVTPCCLASIGRAQDFEFDSKIRTAAQGPDRYTGPAMSARERRLK